MFTRSSFVKTIGWIYLFMVMVLLFISPVFVPRSHFVIQWNFQNTLVECCLVALAFGVWPRLCLGICLAVFIMMVVAVVFIIKRNYYFFSVPLVITLADCVFQVIRYGDNALGYGGLAFKLLGCFVFLLCIIGYRKEKQSRAQSDG